MTPSSPAEAIPATLEDRIHQVELRLIAREDRLWRGAHALQARAHEALQPRRLLKPLAVAGTAVLAGAAGLWLLRRHRRNRSLPLRRDGGALPHRRSCWRLRVVRSVGLLTAVPWAPVMSLLWPLLPQRVKLRTTPGSAAATLSVVLPWMAKLAAPQGSLSLLRLCLTSLNGVWEGCLGLRQQSGGRAPPATQQRSG